MIEEDFYATLKLKSGEEIFAKIAAMEEDDRILLLVSNPVIVSQIKNKNQTVGYKVESWLKTTTEDMFILNIEDVITMSESSDVEMIMIYQNFVRFSQRDNTKQFKLSKEMGYISNVNDAKEILEKLYKNS
jgi:hypothetical protein